MQRHWFVGLWCTSALVAQATRAPELQLPKLLRLGPVPAAVPVTTIGDPGAATALPPAAKAVLLRADQHTPMARVQAALDALAAHGVEQVFLLAQLPDGTPGTLALALPNAGAAPPTVVLRAHHERPGVPPESAAPVLRRLGDGWHAAGRGTFVLGITLPADATHAQLLGLLAMAANAQLRCATVQTTPASQQPAAALALDLEASFVIQVQAREQVPLRPGLQDTPFGLLERAATTAIELPGGRAGGRYGGRGGQAKPAADEGRLALERARVHRDQPQRSHPSLRRHRGGPARHEQRSSIAAPPGSGVHGDVFAQPCAQPELHAELSERLEVPQLVRAREGRWKLDADRHGSLARGQLVRVQHLLGRRGRLTQERVDRAPAA